MNAFESLLSLAEAEKQRRGLVYTPREIAQQPRTWRAAGEMLLNRREEVLGYLRDAGMAGEKRSVLILTGAGSSEFVGNAVAPALARSLGRVVQSMPTTNLVTNPRVFAPGEEYVVVSFARSGNSPESMATFDMVKQVCPTARQIAITCNADGQLARAIRKEKGGLYIALPPETNDQSLVMTSSYSTMAFTAAALGLLETPGRIEEIWQRLGACGERIVSSYGDLIERFARTSFTRAAFLGSNTLWGTMQECHLKMAEMTDGRVATIFNSFVGLRHGPQVFVNDDCVVVASLSSDAYVRRYELDLLRELKAKRQGIGTLVICDKATAEIREIASDVIELFPDGGAVDDEFRIMPDVMVGQMLALFKCMALGLKPDAPSASGTINRVVQGVRVYDYRASTGCGAIAGVRASRRRGGLPGKSGACDRDQGR